MSASEKVAVQPAAGDRGGLTGDRVDRDRRVHLLGLVGFGRGVAHPLAGSDVHKHRAAEAAGMPQRGFHGAFVVTVDRADIFQAQVGEQQLRRQRVLDARLDAVHEAVGDLAEQWQEHTTSRPFSSMCS